MVPFSESVKKRLQWIIASVASSPFSIKQVKGKVSWKEEVYETESFTEGNIECS